MTFEQNLEGGKRISFAAICGQNIPAEERARAKAPRQEQPRQALAAARSRTHEKSCRGPNCVGYCGPL